MRLWHSKLIPLLDGKRLCDLHMSCCNLRGKGWGKSNVAINYIYKDPLGEEALAAYHHLVLDEMAIMDFRFDERWLDYSYCGKNRPSRSIDYRRHEEALLRHIPLEGHTFELYKNDVDTLQERGLDIVLSVRVTQTDDGIDTIWTAQRGNIYTNYIIEIKK